jgi:hypothetical protein
MSYKNLAYARFPNATISGFGRWCVHGLVSGNVWLFSSRTEAEERIRNNSRVELIDLTPTLESQLDQIPERQDARRR